MNPAAAIQELHHQDWRPKYSQFLTIALVTAFFTSNILAYKYVALAGLHFGASAALFPFALIIGDALSEVYGFRQTRNAILISLVCYCFFVAMAFFTVWLPPAPEWKLQHDYEMFFSTTGRVFLGTSLAFLVSQILNAFVFVKIKVLMHGKNFYVRALAATILSEFAHTIVIGPIVFGSILSLDKLAALILTATLIKIGIEILLLPFTWLLICWLKRAEGVDYYDA